MEDLKQPTIRLITNECGEWVVLIVDGTVYDEGHTIPDFTWLKLLSELGCKVEEKEITDEDMEEGNY